MFDHNYLRMFRGGREGLFLKMKLLVLFWGETKIYILLLQNFQSVSPGFNNELFQPLKHNAITFPELTFSF